MSEKTKDFIASLFIMVAVIGASSAWIQTLFILWDVGGWAGVCALLVITIGTAMALAHEGQVRELMDGDDHGGGGE